MLYIQISSDRIQRKKNDILFLFLGGSLATIVLTTLLEAFFVHRIFVPPIGAILSGLKKVEEGDLSIRIVQPGLQDQLGTLVMQVNSMISAIERNTGELVLLNRAGKILAQATTNRQVKRAAIEIIEEYFRGASGAMKSRLDDRMPDLDVNLADSDFINRIMAIIGGKKAPFSLAGSAEFAHALVELVKGVEGVTACETVMSTAETPLKRGFFTD